MNKKESLRMDGLIKENIRLQDAINEHMKIYGEMLSETVLLRTRIETMQEVMNWPLGEEFLA